MENDFHSTFLKNNYFHVFWSPVKTRNVENGYLDLKNKITDEGQSVLTQFRKIIALWKLTIPTHKFLTTIYILGYFFKKMFIYGTDRALDKVPYKPKATEMFKQ